MTSEEFWKRVDVRGVDECWPWKRSRNTDGYGQFSEGGKLLRSTRRVLEMKLGRELLPTERACHTCDNPPCCNPSHLWAGSQGDNIRDAVTKGRAVIPHLTGGAHAFSKLTDEQRADLVTDRGAGMSYRALAKKYGISQPSAFYVCNQGKQKEQWERRKRRLASA